MGEKEISLTGDQLIDLYLLYPEQHVAIRYFGPDLQASIFVFLVGKASDGTGLYHKIMLRVNRFELRQLLWSKGYPPVRWGLCFRDNSNPHVTNITKVIQFMKAARQNP